VNAHWQNFKPFVAPKFVPAMLRDKRNWIGWRVRQKVGKDKVDKIPICIRTGFSSSYARPENHVTYDEAIAAVERLKLDGVGFVLTPDCNVTGVDLDRCREPITGTIEVWAQEVLDHKETYAEYSPSGTGVRLWASGALLKACIKFNAAQVEMYSSGRFLTFTGEHIPGAPLELQTAPRTVAALIARVDKAKAKTTRERGGDKPPSELEGEGAEAFRRHVYNVGPFGRLNQMAIENLGSWVLDLLPAAWAYRDGFRVSSADFNRPNEEDLAVMPNGIVDFGVHDLGDFHGGRDREGRRSPLDIVIEWSEPEPGDFADSAALWRAIRWLAGHLHLSKLDLEAMGFADLDNDDDKDFEPGETICPTIFKGKRAPPQLWIAPQWIPFDVVTGLYGDGGTGKSLLMLMLQTAAGLSGATWLGMPVMGEIVSLGMYCEDNQNELQRRQEWINAAYFIDHDALSNVRWQSRNGLDNTLMTFSRSGHRGQLTRLYRHILEEALDIKAKLVIVDTAADTFGGSELDRIQVRQFVQGALGQIAIKTGGAVICCAHPSLSGLTTGRGTSGSTGWSNAFRSRLYLSHVSDEDPDARTLKRMKANYAPPNATMNLRWNNGLFIPVAADGGPGSYGADPRRVFLDILREMTEQNRAMSPNLYARNYAPRVFSELPIGRRGGFDLKKLANAMEELLIERAILNVNYGKPSDKTTKLIISTGDEKDGETDPF
jgi:AAA domain